MKRLNYKNLFSRMFSIGLLLWISSVSAADKPVNYSSTIQQAYSELLQLKNDDNPNKRQSFYSELQALKQQLKNSRSEYLAEIIGIEAMLYFQATRYEDALQLFNQALFIAQQQDFLQQTVVWQMQQGKLFDAMGKLNDAISSYENAVLANESLDPELLQNHPLVSDSGQLYYELAALYLRKARQEKGKQRSSLIKSAIQAIENRRASELNDYFQTECMSRTGLTSARITEKIDNKSIFLYPVVYSDRIELVFGTSEFIDVVTTDIDTQFVNKLVVDLRDALMNTHSLEYRKPAIELYNLLIKPVATRLTAAQNKNLVIIPDIRLINIPWAALYDPMEKLFLVEKFSIAVLPSLQYTDLRPTKLTDASVLYAGMSEASGDTGALVFVEDEISSLQKITRREKVIMNNQFTRENLIQEINNSNFTIHHLATHANLTSNFKESFITTYNGPLAFDELLKSIASNKYRREAMDMVVLNGCSTASGDNLAALGLAGLTIKSGVKSVVGTLWQVNDEAAMILMTEFYKNLDKNISKSAAMQNAQLHVLKKEDNFAHPAYWSAFLVIGNWL